MVARGRVARTTGRSLAMVAALALASAGSAGAQGLAEYDYENLSFRGIGVHGGYNWADKVEGTNSFGFRVDLGYLGPGVRIVPTLNYWSSDLERSELEELAAQISALPSISDEGVVVTADDLGGIEWSDLAFGLDAQYVWTTPWPLLTYLGVGVGLHSLNGKGSAIDGTFVEDLLDSFAAGVSPVAGVEYMLQERLRVYGEARWNLLSDLNFGGFAVGAQFMFRGRDPTVVGSAPAPPAPRRAR
ncbi:MAG: outer membrane beta-barrel protein [Gemmatimonadota bacterium]